MTKPEEIAEVFGIFHDGSITGGTEAGQTTEMVIDIRYLAERIRPTDRNFTIQIDNLNHMRFTPWTDEGKPLIPDITEFVKIASLDLELLSAEAEGTKVKIACNQARPNLGYCGGFLEMTADSCKVFDESGREWTLEELRMLSDGYWSDWTDRNKNAQQDAS